MSDAHTGSAAGFDYVAYLAAKRVVDDASFAATPREFCVQHLAAITEPSLLELGAGIGTMLVRLLAAGTLRRARYTMLDADRGAAARAHAWLGEAVAELGLRLEGAPGRAQIRGPEVSVELRFVEARLEDWLSSAETARADLVLAHSFWDLVDEGTLLPRLWSRVAPGARYWFTGTFAGETRVAPAHADDAAVWSAYHGSMRARGGPRHAAALRRALLESGAEIDAEGPADQRVSPGPATRPQSRFVGFILDTVECEPAVGAALGPERLEAWLSRRRAQLAAGTLAFEATQVDFAGRAPLR